ncbi:hypothetical protein CEE44_05265 [Candidatus Woesearchaeota archaeon B3_Woes]|nr:MAG: hypothetical protein CEE44_05265 [Candidatus Woesearchaeota archaeon B3_Woes]
MNYKDTLRNYYHLHLTSKELAGIKLASNSQACLLYIRSIWHVFNHHELEETNKRIQGDLPQNLDDVLMEVTGDHFSPTERLNVKASSTKRINTLLPSLKDLRSYFTQLNTYKAVYYKNC